MQNPTLLADALKSEPANTPKTSKSQSWARCQIDAEARCRQNARETAADRAWRDHGPPQRHKDGIHNALSEDGPWIDKYLDLLERLATGMLVALVGPRGTGKTQMAACLMHEMARSHYTVRYERAADLFQHIRACFRDGGGDEARAVEEFARPDMLVIDEAHERGDTEFEDRVLANLIDKRYGALRDTIFISNQPADRFTETMGTSIVSRMQECGGIVECNWPSFRSR